MYNWRYIFTVIWHEWNVSYFANIAIWLLMLLFVLVPACDFKVVALCLPRQNDWSIICLVRLSLIQVKCARNIGNVDISPHFGSVVLGPRVLGDTCPNFKGEISVYKG